METVCVGKSWDVAMAWQGDTLTGVMPYLCNRRLGMTYILQPQLTQFSGPLFFYPQDCSESQRLDFEKDTLDRLLDQVEAASPAFVLMHCSPTITNWLPFYWRGYSQTTRYTYRLEDISDPQRLFEAFDPEKRQRKIRRYNDSTTVRFDMTPSDFATFHRDYWKAKGKKDLLDCAFIERVCRTAIDRSNGVIASLHDEQGRLLVARFVAYDSQCAYALLSACDLQLHRSGHNETLIWKMLQYLSDKTKSFDFEGSMNPGIEYFYRSFGARQTPFFAITKHNRKLFDILMKLKK